MEHDEDRAAHGWESLFPAFRDADPASVRRSLVGTAERPSDEQIRTWDEYLPALQREVAEVLASDPHAANYDAILEYALPLDSRRPDVVLLIRGGVVVLEMKTKSAPSRADVDQVAAYARDLESYHRACWNRPVHPVVVPVHARGYLGKQGAVHVAGPDAIDELVGMLRAGASEDVVTPSAFLAKSAYRPRPSLVRAAREIFEERALSAFPEAARRVAPAIAEITRIIREAAATRTRRLVVLTGIPGAGKTLVGLQIAHARFLDGLVTSRATGKPSAPAVFLSGNGPLVKVLAYQYGSARGGRTFIRSVKDYLDYYRAPAKVAPEEHVVVFDEAQRAWDAKMIAKKLRRARARSQPEDFVEIAERIPDWSVVLALVGPGQEIHTGEEGGLGLWRDAIQQSRGAEQWTVHGARAALKQLEGVPRSILTRALNLDESLRHHRATHLHAFIDALLAAEAVEPSLAARGRRVRAAGFDLLVTRSVESGSEYLRERYREAPSARFGLLASSRDEDLFRSKLSYSPRAIYVAPWFVQGEEHKSSCRHLLHVASEFETQGLELDAALFTWGTDLVRAGGVWSNSAARRHLGARDPLRLRRNAYRVLLTRCREALVVCVPPLPVLDETYTYLRLAGFTDL